VKIRTTCFLLLSAFLFPIASIHGQHATRKRVATGDVVDSIKYYLKLVPLDTAVDKSMPKVNPDDASFIPLNGQPIPVKKVRPHYPEAAKKSGLTGKVWIRFLIGKDGAVKKAEVVKSDSAIFDNAALSAIMQWKFTPAKVKGKPAEVWGAMPFVFSPEGMEK
jgi:TonB family protein